MSDKSRLKRFTIEKLEKNQFPPLYNSYPECEKCGCKEIKEHVDVLKSNTKIWYECSSCGHDFLQLYYAPNYLTPDQYVSWMRDHGHSNYEMLDSDPVWCRLNEILSNERDFHLSPYSSAKANKAVSRNKRNYQIIVARQGQPAPPKDYKL